LKGDDIILKVYTSRINYKGDGRLDITVKSGSKLFAPTWGMVWGIKNKTMTEEEYTKRYINLMRNSYTDHYDEWQELLNKEKVVLCCYCKKGDFCHRYILADILVKLGAEYCGEI
jgi:uncharacterized protein YeaO (DUF488 family)